MEREERARTVRQWLFGGDTETPEETQWEVVFEVMDFAGWLAERRRFINTMQQYGMKLTPSDKALVVEVMKALANKHGG